MVYVVDCKFFKHKSSALCCKKKKIPCCLFHASFNQHKEKCRCCYFSHCLLFCHYVSLLVQSHSQKCSLAHWKYYKINMVTLFHSGWLSNISGPYLANIFLMYNRSWIVNTMCSLDISSVAAKTNQSAQISSWIWPTISAVDRIEGFPNCVVS